MREGRQGPVIIGRPRCWLHIYSACARHPYWFLNKFVLENMNTKWMSLTRQTYTSVLTKLSTRPVFQFTRARQTPACTSIQNYFNAMSKVVTRFNISISNFACAIISCFVIILQSIMRSWYPVMLGWIFTLNKVSQRAAKCCHTDRERAILSWYDVRHDEYLIFCYNWCEGCYNVLVRNCNTFPICIFPTKCTISVSNPCASSYHARCNADIQRAARGLRIIQQFPWYF